MGLAGQPDAPLLLAALSTRGNLGDALAALGRVGLADEAVRGALESRTNHPNADVRRNCAVSLWRLWPSNAVYGRTATRALLQEIIEAERLQRATPTFVQFLTDSDLSSAEASTALKSLLNDDDPVLREHAAKALSEVEKAELRAAIPQ
jgi:HEAT repeat protein